MTSTGIFLDSTLRRPAPLLAPDAGLDEVVDWAAEHARRAPRRDDVLPYALHAVIDERAGTAALELVRAAGPGSGGGSDADREDLLACGAALLNLRLALRGAGLRTVLRLAPDPGRRELLAAVRVAGQGDEADEADEDRELRLALEGPAWHEADFAPGRVPEDLADHLVAEAAYEGAFVAALAGGARGLLRASRRDPVVARDDGSLVFVVGSSDESTEALLRAGSGLQRLLLVAHQNGLAARSLTGLLRPPAVRSAVRHAVDLDHPQALLQVGYPERGEVDGTLDPVGT